MITDLNQLADEVHENAKEKGFHPEEEQIIFVANQCNNMHGEIQELWDSWRKGDEWALCDKPETGLSCTAEELADIIIRALDVSRRLDIDIVDAINAKHEYNKTRPYKHGKKN